MQGDAQHDDLPDPNPDQQPADGRDIVAVAWRAAGEEGAVDAHQEGHDALHGSAPLAGCTGWAGVRRITERQDVARQSVAQPRRRGPAQRGEDEAGSGGIFRRSRRGGSRNIGGTITGHGTLLWSHGRRSGYSGNQARNIGLVWYGIAGPCDSGKFINRAPPLLLSLSLPGGRRNPGISAASRIAHARNVSQFSAGMRLRFMAEDANRVFTGSAPDRRRPGHEANAPGLVHGPRPQAPPRPL